MRERRGLVKEHSPFLPSTVRLRLNVNSDLSLTLKYGTASEVGREGKKERRVTTRLETGLRPRRRIRRGPVLEATVYNCDRSPVYGSSPEEGDGRMPFPWEGGGSALYYAAFFYFALSGSVVVCGGLLMPPEPSSVILRFLS